MIIPYEVLALMTPLDFKSMYELGNKKSFGELPYSEYYKRLGIEYTSIDINGLDGALKLDLNESVDLPPREMVTNIGVTEHVTNQESVFRNIHNLSNRRIVHWVPLVGSENIRHGIYRYYEKFFDLLITYNDYKIKKEFKIKRDNGIFAMCLDLEKTTDKPFIWNEGLMQYITTNKYAKNNDYEWRMLI
jgi:hypothetical protein